MTERVKRIKERVTNVRTYPICTEKYDIMLNAFEKNGGYPVKYHTVAFMSCLQGNAQILQARLQQYVNQELSDVQAGYSKGRGIRDQIANIH